MRFTSLEAWLAWQENCHPREIDLGLDRIRQVAKHMGLLQPCATVVTVAGTNGKGSCVTMLERLLLAQGKTVGAYTSPHLLRYNERIRIGGIAASDDDICAAFAAIDQARGTTSLSYFEFGTLAAFWLFRHYQLDYWVLEVGLGGRLDATNILDADVAVVTSIAIDHQQYLGSDRETIGREKAGIFRLGKPVVCADRPPAQSVLDYAEALECPLYLAGQAFDWQVEGDHWLLNLSIDGCAQSLELPVPQLPLPSVAAAFQVLMLLGQLHDLDVVAKVCETTGLAGRFQQVLCEENPVYLDVAHNPAAAEFLAQRLQAQQLKNLGIVAAMMADKDIEASLRPLQPFVHHWWLAGLPHIARAAHPNVLYDILKRLGVNESRITIATSVEDAVTEALNGGLQQHQCEALLVTGSFYTVSAALQQCSMPLKKEH